MNLDPLFIDVIEFRVVTSLRKRDVTRDIQTRSQVRDGDGVSAQEAMTFFTEAVSLQSNLLPINLDVFIIRHHTCSMKPTFSSATD